MNNLYSINFTENMWDRIAMAMLSTENPILQMMAKAIMEQIGMEKANEQIKKEYHL